MPHTVDAAGRTDVGRVRSANEDQFLVAELDKSLLVQQTSLATDDMTRLFGGPKGHLFVVADGMGGVSGGQRASGLAVRALARYVLTTMPWFTNRTDEDDDPGEDLRAALEACQKAVRAAAEAEPGHDRMGTTLTLAYVLWPRLYVIHAGDSRAYLVRDGRLHQITRDHTVAQRMIDQGRITPEEAEGTRWSHVLWNCIGGGKDELTPDVYKSVLKPGDVLLLCTDGLAKYVDGPDLLRLLGTDSAGAAAARLVDAANVAGGRDNVTVIVARFRDDDPTAF
jgi:serine/threonine protein phosphatase PrpC